MQADAQARLEARQEFEDEVAALSNVRSTGNKGTGAVAAAAAVSAKVAEAKSILMENRQQLDSMDETTAEMASGAKDFANMAAQLNRRP